MTEEPIDLSPDKLKEFKRQYKHAVDNNIEVFIFEGKEVLASFAKYLIEYFENGKPNPKRMQEDMQTFQDSAQKMKINMAVVMYMVEAIKLFESQSIAAVKKLALEIAMQGAMGYAPAKEGYKFSPFKDRNFSGWHILAFYYVSFAIALPELLPKLELPYEKEYALAKTMI